MLNGILSFLGTGSPWRDLPERYGPCATDRTRFDGRAKAGEWVNVVNALAGISPDFLVFIASSIIRAHQPAAGEKGRAKITPSVALVGG